MSHEGIILLKQLNQFNHINYLYINRLIIFPLKPLYTLLVPTVGASLFNTKSCSHIYLLKVECFSVLIENLILRGEPTIIIRDIPTRLEPILV